MSSDVLFSNFLNILNVLNVGTLIAFHLLRSWALQLIVEGNNIIMIFIKHFLGVAPMGFIADKIGARVLITIAIGGSGAISLLTEGILSNLSF